MSDNSGNSSGAAPIFAFLGGGLIIAIIVLGLFVAHARPFRHDTGHPQNVSLNFKMPLRR
jgi:hypothetical protein